ncbi:mRNA capping enzyme, alpha subunit [Sporormia fimetaria CBS 119925]|uniref:mRNA-capping enzyme subunit alpha n=1 Tax=Sporormia fimetaria CBS 119925 TaxID=1340428 RepID=A0A6A6V080_9PLEO|nr:mRNA capping enzyme, alpha subunit [Sporormia fimetaria CBS 119925]
MHSSVPPQIPGEQVPDGDAEGLREYVAQLLQRGTTRFPGAQPVSFAREHISKLQEVEYFMCEKTDGVRVLLFLHYISEENSVSPATLLIDRKNNYYDVRPPLRFPYYKDPNDPNMFLCDTILDGELVHDVVAGQPPRLIFYAFDCLVMDGINHTKRTLDKRIGYMKEQLFKPYYHWLKTHNNIPMSPEPFRVKEKQVYSAYNLTEMFNTILPNLPHGNDGLVFTCKTTPYNFGTDKNILKWKPPHENTIDFKLRIGEFPPIEPEEGDEGPPYPDYDAVPDARLLVQHNKGDYRVFAPLYLPASDWESMKSLNQRLDGRIIECYRDAQGRWRYKQEADGTPRWRDDKTDANHISTVSSVLESLQDPVTEEDLLAAEERIRREVKRMRREEEERVKIWQREQAEKVEAGRKRRFSAVGGEDEGR